MSSQVINAQHVPQKRSDENREIKEVIIKFKDSDNLRLLVNNGRFLKDNINQICERFGNFSASRLKSNDISTSSRVKRPRVHSYITVSYESGIDLNTLLKELNSDNDIEYAEANGYMYGSTKTIEDKVPTVEESMVPIVPNDPNYDFFMGTDRNVQWWCNNRGIIHEWSSVPDYFPTCVVGADIDMEEAWEITTGEKSVVIAHMDTGMRLVSPDLQGRIKDGYDFINNDDDPTDDHGHGSNTGGICFATGNNNSLHAGVNWQSDVLIAKVLDANNQGQWNDLADGIIWAVDNGASLITASIGGQSPPQLLKDAVEYAYANNVAIIAASGNEDQNTDTYPASYPEVISVGATTCNDARVSNNVWGSNYHSTVDLVAPGSYILGLGWENDEAGRWFGGTSMATPMVAGAISLMLSLDPSLTVEELRTILHETSEDQVGKPNEDVAGFDIYHGHGRLNVFNALSALVDCDNAVEGAPCDDNNLCTINDVYNDVCLCRGTFQDSDNDGVCDNDDLCSGFDDNIDIDEDDIPDACDDDVDCAGIACDDSDSCTVNDVYDSNCSCAGISLDEVDNGSCNLSAPYCGVTGGNGVSLSNVNIGNVNNSSGSNGYTDYSGDFALLADAGETVSVNLTLDNSAGIGGTGSWVYIDFDQNGIFDANERVIDVTGDNVNTSFTVPSSALDGATIMRVYGYLDFIFVTPSGPCSDSEFAEIEDYAVIIGYDQLACNPGAACNDNDQCTTNDVFDANCDCTGTFADSDNDGVCDADDVCPNFNDSLIGSACDDGDVCTTGEVYDSNCNCTGGVIQDSDNDGVCDADDVCAGGDDMMDSDGDGIPDFCDNCNIVNGTACNDGDPCTTNDIYTNCNCAGSFADSDNDGVCDANDICQGGDDMMDSDGDGIPDFCDNCNIVNGTVCNDGDPCTTNDVYTNCNCSGNFQDSDNDGVCDSNDICAGGDDTLDTDGDGIPDFCDNCNIVNGTVCNDGDPCTINDSYTNCNCSGVFQDSDNDSVCDINDICSGGDDNIDTDGDGTPDFCDTDCVTLASDDFEASSGIWISGGIDADRINSANSPSGSYSFRIRDNSLVASSMYTQAMNYSSYSQMQISFAYQPIGMESGKDFYLEISADGGTTFSTIGNWISGIDFSNNIIYNEIIDITPQYLTTSTVIRFRCNGTINADEIYLDNIKIESCEDDSDCEDYLIENQNQIVNTSQSTILGIETNSIIGPNSNIEYSAGEFILLNEGFEVKPQASFHAFIEACQN